MLEQCQTGTMSSLDKCNAWTMSYYNVKLGKYIGGTKIKPGQSQVMFGQY